MSRLSRLTYPDDSLVDRTYTARGQLYQVKYNRSVINTRAYDNGGRLSTSTYGNGVVATHTYRNNNLTQSLEIRKDSNVLDSFAYTWCDPKGNLTLNVTGHRYFWDFDNQLQGVDITGDQVADVTFGYDALGRRVKKTASGATKVYVCKTEPIAHSPDAGQEIAEYVSGAAPSSPTEKYIDGDYIDEPIWKTGTGSTVYYQANSLYCVSALTNTSGAVVERYRYTPYGVLTILAPDGTTVRTSSSYANPYTYTGRRWDPEVSLYYYRARCFSAQLGRFCSRDPVGYWDGVNLVEYVWDAPTSRRDPSGLQMAFDPAGLRAMDFRFAGFVPGRLGTAGSAATAGWQRILKSRPKFLSPGYDFWVNFVVPQPAMSQVWQVTSFTRLLVRADSNNTSKCPASLKTIFKLDVRNIGADEEIIPDNIGSTKLTGVICLDLQIVVHVIGFGGVLHLLPVSSGDITASDASRLVQEMRPPVNVFFDVYTFLKKSNCKCCPLLESVLTSFRVPDGEFLYIGGDGTWSN